MDSFLQILQQEQENPSSCDDALKKTKVPKKSTLEQPPQPMTQTRFSMQSVTMARASMTKEALIQSVMPSSSVKHTSGEHTKEEDTKSTSVFI